VRLFVGIWPPPAVCAVLAGLPRPADPDVRWTTPDQWHATLRFLGEVPDDDVAGLGAALGQVGVRHGPRTARLGPATTRLGRGTLAVPLAGVDDLAAAVTSATAAFGRPAPPRAFAGHLTVARGRGRRPVPSPLTGHPVDAPWPVAEVVLVRSRLDRAGARYDTVATVPLTGPPPAPPA
jgi:2'-5' RNA ligase